MPPGSEPIQPLGGRLRRVGEMLIGLSGSPVPTHLFQTLAEQAETLVPHDYLAVCLEDAEQQGYLVHSLSGLVGEPVASRLFSREEGLPGRTIRTGRAHLVGELERIADGAPDIDGVLVRAGLQAALAVPLRRGMQILGQDGLVLLANPAARAMLGVAPESMTGRPFFQAVEHEPLRRLFEIGQPGVVELSCPTGGPPRRASSSSPPSTASRWAYASAAAASCAARTI
jgi:PAS domain-containing protein